MTNLDPGDLADLTDEEQVGLIEETDEADDESIDQPPQDAGYVPADAAETA